MRISWAPLLLLASLSVASASEPPLEADLYRSPHDLWQPQAAPLHSGTALDHVFGEPRLRSPVLPGFKAPLDLAKEQLLRLRRYVRTPNLPEQDSYIRFEVTRSELRGETRIVYVRERARIQISDMTAVGAVVGLLHHALPASASPLEVRLTTAFGTSRILHFPARPPPKFPPRLAEAIRRLTHSDIRAGRAISDLLQLGRAFPAARSALRACLERGPTPVARARAGYVLALHGDAAALPALRRLSECPSLPARFVARLALCKRDPDRLLDLYGEVWDCEWQSAALRARVATTPELAGSILKRFHASKPGTPAHKGLLALALAPDRLARPLMKLRRTKKELTGLLLKNLAFALDPLDARGPRAVPAMELHRLALEAVTQDRTERSLLFALQFAEGLQGPEPHGTSWLLRDRRRQVLQLLEKRTNHSTGLGARTLDREYSDAIRYWKQKLLPK
jgi:hypothetical protein